VRLISIPRFCETGIAIMVGASLDSNIPKHFKLPNNYLDGREGKQQWHINFLLMLEMPRA